jgi:hypothetical protein
MEYLVRLAHKQKIIIVLMVLIANSYTVFAQANSLKTFKSFIARNYRIPDLPLNDCNWNYAIVKASVGADNTVHNLTFLNEIEPGMQESFDFIKGYSFGEHRSYKKKAIIFILTVDLNNWRTCNTVKLEYSPGEAITRVLSILDKELSANPTSLVLYHPITVFTGKTEN